MKDEAAVKLRGRWGSGSLCGALASVVALAGCDVGGTLEKVGLADPAPLGPELIDVVCDPSVGSTCTSDTLGNTLAVVLGRVAMRPGSLIRMWVLGEAVEATAIKAEVAVPVQKGKTPRARAANAVRWQSQQRELLLASVTSSLSDKHPLTSSPLAEAVTKVSLADSHGLSRKMVVITDGRETGVADFECGRLPSDKVWESRLNRLSLLNAGTLAGIEVSFTYMTQPPIERCAVSIKREMRIRVLWSNALHGAGGSDVRMLSGPVTWDERVAVRAEEDAR